MLKYDTRALLEGKFTYYELVIAVAKRARSISDQAELEHEVLDVKPVRLAIDELQNHRAHIEHVEPSSEEETPAEPKPMPYMSLNETVDFSDDGDEDENKDEDGFDDEEDGEEDEDGGEDGDGASDEE